MALRWGIVSAGKISNDFVCAVKTLPKSDHEIVAVAARSLSSAENFAKSNNIPKAYEGYLKLSQDEDIDIAYIGNLNRQHFEVAKLMLENGKHVLCEKPLTINEKQTSELLKLAKNKKVFFMEAIWSRAFPAYDELRKLLAAGSIGEILNVNLTFGFHIAEVERLRSKELGGGVILDLGVYTLQFQQLVFQGATPEKVVACGTLNEEGVDESVTAILSYSTGQAATFTISSKAEYPNEATIIGTKGIIKIPQFWCPTKLITKEKTYEFELPKSDSKFNFLNSVGLSYEAEHARQCISSGKTESLLVSHKDTLQLAQLMDALRKQVGVTFSEDSL